jgi:hypothetical protein
VDQDCLRWPGCSHPGQLFLPPPGTFNRRWHFSRRNRVAYYTRVLSKVEEFPALEELAGLLQAQHPGFKLTLESGTEEEWETLLLSSIDEVEVAVLEHNPVYDGSAGQDEIADFIEDLRDCRPASGVEWLVKYLDEVKTIYAFQHLQGSEMVDGGNALHGLRAALWERGDAIMQADEEGFTNEEGYNIVWQFSDSVSGPWNMGVYKDDLWHHFKMDLGDPDHREAFLNGEVPDDLSAVKTAGPQD